VTFTVPDNSTQPADGSGDFDMLIQLRTIRGVAKL
jgi:hypothetical protein